MERTAEYFNLHAWMNYHHPRTGCCQQCGSTDRKTEYAALSYTKDRSDWLEVCRSCHRILDGHGSKIATSNRRRASSACVKCGSDDWYITPKGWRQCRPCQTLNKKRWADARR